MIGGTSFVSSHTFKECSGRNRPSFFLRPSREPRLASPALLDYQCAGKMIGSAKIYFVVYGALTIIGGLIGYFKAGSAISAVSGTIAGILLLLAAWLLSSNQLAGLLIALVVSLLLAGRFLPKFISTGKVMPAGMMSLLSVVGLVFVVAAWLKR